jgi:hypothetical protein
MLNDTCFVAQQISFGTPTAKLSASLKANGQVITFGYDGMQNRAIKAVALTRA